MAVRGPSLCEWKCRAGSFVLGFTDCGGFYPVFLLLFLFFGVFFWELDVRYETSQSLACS